MPQSQPLTLDAIPLLEQRQDALEKDFGQLREEMGKGFANVSSQIETKFRSLSEAFSAASAKSAEAKRTNFFGIAGIMAVVISACWTIIGMRTDSRVTPLEASVAYMQAELKPLPDKVSELRAELSTDRESLSKATAEIETQFDLLSQMWNMRWAEQQRNFGIIWNKNPDLGPAPTGPWFFPNVSNRNHENNQP